MWEARGLGRRLRAALCACGSVRTVDRSPSGGGDWGCRFTVQSWTLLTVYFLGAAACSAAVAYGPAPGVAAQPWSDNVAVVLLVLYEMNVTLALLVTVIVTFFP